MAKESIFHFGFENNLESVDKLFLEIEAEILKCLNQALPSPSSKTIAHYLGILRPQMAGAVGPILYNTSEKRGEDKNVARLSVITLSTCIVIYIKFKFIYNHKPGNKHDSFTYGSAKLEQGLPYPLAADFSDTSR